MKHKKIKSWKTKAGLQAVVFLVSPAHPHYCGYVAVPKEHKAFGCEYYVFFEEGTTYEKEFRSIQEQVNEISVHGGLTYAEETNTILKYPAVFDNNVYWFGFDAAHSGDAINWEEGKILIETTEERKQAEISKRITEKFPIESDTIKNLDYMVEECELLATQLMEIK